MKIRKSTLWRVPLYSVLAGIVTSYAVIHFGGLYFIETLPDGSVTVNDTRNTIMYAVFFVVVILVGGLVFFRKMTRREIFWSATVLVAVNLAARLLQQVFYAAGSNMLGFAYFWMLFEWTGIVGKLLDSVWIGSLIQLLIPYLFMLFGKKEVESVSKELS